MRPAMLIETNKKIYPIPYKEAWQPENKQWLINRKEQWKTYLEKEPVEPGGREYMKAEKHFFLMGELPEDANIRYKTGEIIILGLSSILTLHPMQKLEVWLALFDWISDFEQYQGRNIDINDNIANVIKQILIDTKRLYEQDSAQALYQLVFGDEYKTGLFEFKNGQFYGSLFSAEEYYERWIAWVDNYLTSDEYQHELAFPILDNLDYLLTCFPYIDKSVFELIVDDPDRKGEKMRNSVLCVMHLVHNFINPRALLNKETEEKYYAKRLVEFFEIKVPNVVKALWDYVKNEVFCLKQLTEVEPGLYQNPFKANRLLKLKSIRSLEENQFMIPCNSNNQKKEVYFSIIHERIHMLGLTENNFNSKDIKLVDIKGIGIYDDFFLELGYTKSQAVPAWSYKIRANNKLINHELPIVLEVLIIISNNGEINYLYIHQRPEQIFKWEELDFFIYGELMHRQIMFSLLTCSELKCSPLSEEKEYSQFYISHDMPNDPEYDFPLYKGKNKPVWE